MHVILLHQNVKGLVMRVTPHVWSWNWFEKVLFAGSLDQH